MKLESKKILLVEDDPNFGSILKEYLSINGYDVTLAKNGIEGFEKFKKDMFDLCLLDVMMPYKDGFTLAKEIREKNEAVPLIFITAKTLKEDVLKGFKLGADDYLGKPFEPKELLLRIDAILRRMPEPSLSDVTPKILYLGAVRYDVDRGELWRGDVLVRLTATETQLMQLFASTPGEAVSRLQLVEDLGRDDERAQERAVDVQVTRLRRKIESDPKEPRYLQTVRGAGYMLTTD